MARGQCNTGYRETLANCKANVREVSTDTLYDWLADWAQKAKDAHKAGKRVDARIDMECVRMTANELHRRSLP